MDCSKLTLENLVTTKYLASNEAGETYKRKKMRSATQDICFKDRIFQDVAFIEVPGIIFKDGYGAAFLLVFRNNTFKSTRMNYIEMRHYNNIELKTAGHVILIGVTFDKHLVL